MERTQTSAEVLAEASYLKQLGTTMLVFSAGAPAILAYGEATQGELPNTAKLLCYGVFAVGAVLGSKIRHEAAATIERAGTVS